jgi:biopolymer transport protein ExbB/TolQ
MTTLDHIRELLHLVAGILIWPVMAGLLGLAALSIIVLGAYAREAWDRYRGSKPALVAAMARLDECVTATISDALDLRLERTLQQEERRRWQSIARLRLAVRVGPALGLMGTLIPMAYALQGLAEGNLPALASNMVTAFAATVIGLAISVIAYLVSSSREAWVRADTQALALHAEQVLRAAASPKE